MFDSGVSSYITGVTEITQGFPVDHKGKAYVACKYCRFFIGRHCIITSEIVPFPDTHIGRECPLVMEDVQEEYDG
ncbi:hypothetical protein [Treponema sp.]|uniref:hypothetical protein n=1 Tax=Treponema sp. TaxID=166 RepID=UPI003890E469